MPAERVVIDIEVNSDIATIEATREALERLTNAQKRYNRERDREPSGGRGGGGRGDDDGVRGRGGGGGGGRRGRGGRYSGFAGQVFDFRGDVGKAIGAYGSLLRVVNKLAMISLPLMLGTLGLISVAFRMGTYFVNMYRAAMASMASAVGVAFVGLTTLLAAQKEFAVVQNSPAYYKGSINTTDRFVAAGQAMSMFTANTNLAVVGAKGLQSAFTTLSKVQPVTGATVGAFTTLMDVVAGSGGDIEKDSGKLAEFLAAVQKKGSLAGGSEAAKALGPDFEKIVKEAGALGIKTSDEFLKAAAEGKLGETFASKYAGTLDALNNTVMGRFKSAITAIKGQLTDLGGEYLSETGGAIVRLQGIIQKTISRLAYVLQSFDVSGKMGNFLDMVDKGADKFIFLMNKYLGTSPNLFQFFGDAFDKIGNAFDRMQDWMRQFEKAGALINKHFFKPLFNVLGDSFTSSMKDLSGVIENQAPLIESFATQLGNTLVAIGKYGDVVRRLFIGAIPFLNIVLKVVEMFFKGLDKFGEAAIVIGDIFAKLGPLGKVAGALVKVAALYSLFTLATRFFKVFGTMFGKNMKGTMNISAGVVNVNGGMMPGAGMGRGLTSNQMTGKGYMTMRQRAQSFGRQYGRFMPAGMGSMLAGGAMMMGGSTLSGMGDNAGGYSSLGGSAMKTAGMAATVAGGAKMMGLSMKTGGALAIPVAAYGAGSYIGGKFNDDSLKSKASSAGLSALAGAGTGAAIGGMLGGPVGAAAGAIVGGIVGGVTGWMKAGKMRKDIQSGTKQFVEDYTNQVNEAMVGGNLDDLLKARDDMMAARDKIIKESGDPTYQAKVFNDYADKLDKLNNNITNVEQTVNIAGKYFGKSFEELNKIASDSGVDLSGKFRNFREVLNLVGKTVEERARLMKLAMANLGSAAVGSAMSYFDKIKQAEESSKLVDADASRLLTGQTDDKTIRSFLENSLNFNVAKYGDVAGLANTFGGIQDMFAEGGALGSLDQKTKDKMMEELLNAGIASGKMLENLDFNEMSVLFGGNKALESQGIMKKDASGNSIIDPTLLKNLITTKIKDDPYFLANLIAAQSTGVGSAADAATRNVLGGGTGQLGVMTGVSGEMDAGERRFRLGGTGYIPPSNQANNYNVQTVVNASVLDGKTIQQIEAAIAKAIRDQKERGATTPVTRR